MNIRATLLLFISAALSINLSAQLAYGGAPKGFSASKLTVVSPPTVLMPAFDIEAIRAQHDALHAQGKGPWLFGKNFDTNISTQNSGIWEILPNGDHLWRVSIKSKKALSINFLFSEFEVPEGGKVFVYNPDMTTVLGSFDQRNRVDDNGKGVLGVQAIAGDEIIIEYLEPADRLGQGKLKIGQVTHAYRDIWNFAKGLGDSGSCNINVICPIADDYRADISSVAIITTGGNGFCTGTVINNCAQDSTPYFLTADHCLSGSVAGWTFQFHWESDDCTANNNGPTNYTVSGASLLVNDPGTDVALLEIASNIPDSFKVCFAGWDHSGTTPDTTYCIHHPSGDIKKFSMDYDPPTQTTWGSPPADVWEVAAWDDGTTEPGSSGSGLWSISGHLIGQLYGGSASCTSNTNDDYGRLDVSWPLLEQWLGQCGPVLDRFCPNGSFGGGATGGSGGSGGSGTGQVHDLDVGVSSIQNLELINCDVDTIYPKITLKNHGNDWVDSVKVHYQWDNGPVFTTMFVGQITTLQTANFFMAGIPVLPNKHVLKFFTAEPNSAADQNTTNDTLSMTIIAYNPSIDLTFDIYLDDFGAETTWELRDDDGLLLHEGGPYTDGNAGLIETTSWCLGTGCYELTIFDSFGDGICCNEGNGYYQVYDTLTTSYFTPVPAFGSSITHQFCTVSVGIDEGNNNEQLVLYPNPSTGLVNVAISTLLVGGQLTVYNALGAVVRVDQATTPGNHVLDLSGLPGGMYMIEMRGNNSRRFGRVVLE